MSQQMNLYKFEDQHMSPSSLIFTLVSVAGSIGVRVAKLCVFNKLFFPEEEWFALLIVTDEVIMLDVLLEPVWTGFTAALSIILCLDSGSLFFFDAGTALPKSVYM